MDWKTILVVDDAEINRAVLAEAFKSEYTIVEAENGKEALERMSDTENIVAVLLDVYMPVLDGFAVLERMAEQHMLERTPVFLVTAEGRGDMMERAYRLGVVDVIHKPFDPSFIRRRVGNILELYQHRLYLQDMVHQQTAQLEAQSAELKHNVFAIIETLSTAIEFRDCESGDHVNRIRRLTALLLSAYQKEHPDAHLSPERIELISEAAVMHDVGKITIPDNILNKPGRLTTEEFEIMKLHTSRGCELLDHVDSIRNSDIFQYAYDICRHHHERFDGGGYPDGLKGNEISIWAQVVSLADVYDALVNERVYKKAIAPEIAIGMILRGECGVFNPEMLSIFEREARTSF